MSKKRKDEHIMHALNQVVSTNDFDKIRLIHHSVPSLNIDDINIETKIFDKPFSYPFYINAMTGGASQSENINTRLLKLATTLNIPFFVGSQSIAFKDASVLQEFKALRASFPQAFIVGNINANFTKEMALEAVNMLSANALAIHVNSVQELTMEEGDRSFSSWQQNIKEIIKTVNVPVIIKEVGYGMHKKTVALLKRLGARYIDISGAGGTDFSKIELARQQKEDSPLLSFSISTVEALLDLQEEKDVTIHASGGVRNGLDVVKALALGAKAVGMSRYFLNLTELEEKEAFAAVNELIDDMKKIMILVNAKNVSELNKDLIYLSPLL